LPVKQTVGEGKTVFLLSVLAASSFQKNDFHFEFLKGLRNLDLDYSLKLISQTINFNVSGYKIKVLKFILRKFNPLSDFSPQRGMEIILLFHIHVPVMVAERSKACTAFTRSEAGIMGSNHTQGMDVLVSVCIRAFFCVCVQVEALRRADHQPKVSY
jgi:hypothetical protein